MRASRAQPLPQGFRGGLLSWKEEPPDSSSVSEKDPLSSGIDSPPSVHWAEPGDRLLPLWEKAQPRQVWNIQHWPDRSQGYSNSDTR